jgi:hypothetical protein
MSDDLFEEGGEHNIRKTGKDEFQFSIEIPEDEHGMVARECVEGSCSPGYFKVKLGTGIVEDHNEAFCPYCRSSADPSEFLTKAQREYAESVLLREAQKGIDKLVRKSLGLGPSGRKKIAGGLLSIELNYKPAKLNPVPRPYEEELRRDVVCPVCTLEHAVFGLASWCADCGKDIFLTHVDKEFEVIESILAAVKDRRKHLGARIAARDIENSLEDTVSIFEAVLKHMTRRALTEAGKSQDEIHRISSTEIRNSYQSITRAQSTFEQYFGFPLFEDPESDQVGFIREAFEKRHPITHNLGVVDREYLKRVASGELEGRELKLSEEEVLETIRIAKATISAAYHRAFPDSHLPSVDA